jgi:signal transduction histidine kinase/DNA-binding response OmpR family regulator
MSLRILTTRIMYENDVVAARQRARQIAELLGFESQDQTRISTAISELARNALVYGGGGRLDFSLEGTTAPQVLLATISDQGPGIANVEEILAGSYRSQTGMGLGILGARRLMDGFQIQSAPGEGTTIQLRKVLPARSPLLSGEDLARVADALANPPDGKPRTLLEELQQQNRELVQMLDELRARQEELSELNAELADTNRGVIALYAELDEKADHLRRADQLKSKFLSNMSHEFRTPLNSILALTRLLLERVDGPLTAGQETQVGYVRKSAQDLYELVNDLLDLARVEAGKIVIRPSEFSIDDLFGALRGMLRPLLLNPAVALTFADTSDLPPVRSDEGKVSQILRNFIANALKFTESGEIRVSARLVNAGEPLRIPHERLGEEPDPPIADQPLILFAVEDTGIGIAAIHHEHIFQEFGQLENPIQRQVRGTGLGLPLSRKLAQLLSGDVRLRSAEGLGSTFAAIIPLNLPSSEAAQPLEDQDADAVAGPTVLIIEDSAEDRLILQQMVGSTQLHTVFATTPLQGRDLARQIRPAAIILDIILQGQPCWSLLSDLKRDPATSDIPVVVTTTLLDNATALGLGAEACFNKPLDGGRLREILTALVATHSARRGPSILIIEDDEAHRYILRGLLAGNSGPLFEATDGIRGLEMAVTHRPGVILLDLALPGLSGDRVLRQLKADPLTAVIPVIIATSEALTPERRTSLEKHAAAILDKKQLSGPDLLETVARVSGNNPNENDAEPASTLQKNLTGDKSVTASRVQERTATAGALERSRNS